MYRGKVTYYISDCITQTFLKFLYLDYHRRTYITASFQYNSRSFDIRNASLKKSIIWIVTNYGLQLWKNNG